MNNGNGSSLPKHIAFILDGNGRWAQQRGLNRIEGHQAGVDNTREIVKALANRGIEFASFYTFSTENWTRPKHEVKGIFDLLERVIESETLELHKNNVRILHIGRREEISPIVRQALDNAVQLTRNNTRMTACFALNYGGRREIVDAARRLVSEKFDPEKIDEKLFSSFLYTAGLPDVDLLIRTGGELRISNFLLWQAAYAELYFSPVLWPDFNDVELDKALLAYTQRQRRFGGLSAKSACSKKGS